MLNKYSRVALIGCSGEKLSHAAQIRNLYTSRRFREEVRHAQDVGYRPFVLSARHGLLDLDEVREPYDETLEDKTPEELAEWATRVMNRLVKFLDIGPGTLYVRVYAAGVYAESLHSHLVKISKIQLEYPFGPVVQHASAA